MASNTPTPRFAEGEDPQQLGSDTAALQQQGWTLDADGMGVTKTFHFKSYFKAVVSEPRSKHCTGTDWASPS
jgi:4a-hydroxytetrahydrobiopterin dehydratase